MSPEILKKERYKKPADIYSFAITILEVMIWKEVFPKIMFRYPWNIANFITEGNRPETIEEVTNEGMKEIIENSWKQKPEERIEIKEIVQLLENEMMKLK